jgi:hypothetical protein
MPARVLVVDRSASTRDAIAGPEHYETGRRIGAGGQAEVRMRIGETNRCFGSRPSSGVGWQAIVGRTDGTIA